MRAFHVALAALAIFGSAAHSEAAPQMETEKSVALVAINEELAIVSVVNPGDSLNCVFGLIGFDATTTTGAIFYASLLSAKAANRTVTLSYDRVDTGCRLTQVVVN
jgi:hypothetical protein